MDVHQIQTVTLTCLRSNYAQVLKSKIYAVSDDPDEEIVETMREMNRRGPAQDIFFVQAVMSFDEFMSFRAAANMNGVWVMARWSELGQTADKFRYEIAAVEKR